MVPAPPPAPASADLLLRVGLLSDQTALTLPCCAPELHAAWQGKTWSITRALHVEPAPEGTEPGIFRVQVAALRDPGQAESLARSLQRAAGEPADSVLDAESGLYRVRIGRYANKEAAEAARRGLTRFGVGDAWVVSEGGGVREPALRLTQGDMVVTAPGRWIAVDDGSGNGILVGGHRYRGRILVYLNDRGTLNLINEVPLEEYLRGVVPRELGPAAYPELEALKAQAVAARTYAVRNLGEFAEEGYDICATPRCQVYGGIDDEHPLLRPRDRGDRRRGAALARPADRRPLQLDLRRAHRGRRGDLSAQAGRPYLRGVPCLEAGVAELGGAGVRQRRSRDAVTTALVARRRRTGVAALGARLGALASSAGLSPVPATLSSARRPRRAALPGGSSSTSPLDARLFVAAEDLPYLVQSPPPAGARRTGGSPPIWSRAGSGAAAAAGNELTAAEAEELLCGWRSICACSSERGGELPRPRGGHAPRGGGTATRDVTLPPRPRDLPPPRRAVPGGDLSLVAGDRLRLYLRRATR